MKKNKYTIKTIKRKIRNRSNFSQITTYSKKIIKNQDTCNSIQLFNKVQSLISKAVKKKNIKKNNASRRIKKLNFLINKLHDKKKAS